LRFSAASREQARNREPGPPCHQGGDDEQRDPDDDASAAARLGRVYGRHVAEVLVEQRGDAAKVLGHGGRARVAPVHALGQRARADPTEVDRHAGHLRVRGRRRRLQGGQHDGIGSGTIEGRPTSEHLVKDTAEREDVAARVGALTRGFFRRQIPQRRDGALRQ